MSPVPATRVLLVEDHRLVREALRDALAQQSDITVVGEAGDAASAQQLARSLAPDVVVLDIGLPDLNGMELAARLRRPGGPAIVALSAYTDKRFVTEMLRSGASAYVTKSAAGTELVRAIRAVAAGQSYLCPEVAGALIAEVAQGAQAGAAQRLGRRERDVLRLIAEGHRSAAIAEQLHISLGTVEVHRRNIMRKLDLRTVAELTRYAIREGIVAP
ncbi:MAG: response regulator transcription factor [Burkholderiaceae bacterium]